jgi:hypothetical protein
MSLWCMRPGAHQRAIGPLAREARASDECAHPPGIGGTAAIIAAHGRMRRLALDVAAVIGSAFLFPDRTQMIQKGGRMENEQQIKSFGRLVQRDDPRCRMRE